MAGGRGALNSTPSTSPSFCCSSFSSAKPARLRWIAVASRMVTLPSRSTSPGRYSVKVFCSLSSAAKPVRTVQQEKARIRHRTKLMTFSYVPPKVHSFSMILSQRFIRFCLLTVYCSRKYRALIPPDGIRQIKHIYRKTEAKAFPPHPTFSAL